MKLEDLNPNVLDVITLFEPRLSVITASFNVATNNEQPGDLDLADNNLVSVFQGALYQAGLMTRGHYDGEFAQ